MIIEKLDTWIISRIFDPISLKVQKRTGHTCYYLAWWAVGLAMLVGFVDISQHLRLAFEAGPIPPEMAAIFWMNVVGFPFFAIICVVNLYTWQKLWERKKWQSSALPETRTVWWICARLYLATTSLVLLVSGAALIVAGETSILEFFLSTFDFIFLTIGEYFAACTPMPPSAHSKREEEPSAVSHATALRRNAA